MGFGPAYVAHIPPLEGWYSRDSLCYGVGARVATTLARYSCAPASYRIGRDGACTRLLLDGQEERDENV